MITLEQLGPARSVGERIEHVVVCEGRLLVTFDKGWIGEMDRERLLVRRRLQYGEVLPDAARTGVMACGADSVFVAMPREATVVRISLSNLQVLARIRVGYTVRGLAFSQGILYVLDSTQNALITVNVSESAPWRWTVTTSAPELIAGLGDGGILVTHRNSPCLGAAVQGRRKEHGQPWSVRAGARAIALAGPSGALLDGAGYLHRFDAYSGRRTAQAIKLPEGRRITSLALAPNGRVIGAVPTKRMLVAVEPFAWRARGDRPPRARECLP